jgi:hypothetical protein
MGLNSALARILIRATVRVHLSTRVVSWVQAKQLMKKSKGKRSQCLKSSAVQQEI